MHVISKYSSEHQHNGTIDGGSPQAKTYLKELEKGSASVMENVDDAVMFLERDLNATLNGKTIDYRIENPSSNRNGIKNGHFGVDINYWNSEMGIKGTITIAPKEAD